ncbi:MAG: hypothetical protein K6G60_01855 [Lachnospiraceae bacterium]|nr:hypothetical protein [Lachnospiraceae bacterium]
MGFFDLFKKRKADRAPVKEKDKNAVSESALNDRQARMAFLESNCEIIVAADKQILESRKEYEVVTGYLSDIQKIDAVKPEERKEINESANRIINLNNERRAMQHTPPKITIAQRYAIEQEEEGIEAEIKKLAENEAYKGLVENDLKVLEDERDSLDQKINRNISKTEFNRKILTLATVFIGIALIFLIIARIRTGSDVTLVFALVVAFGGLCALYFFLVHRRMLKDTKMNEAMLGRAITLINKTKIKYVNVTNVLDYNYEKFHVSGSQDLSFNWKEYNRIVEEERRFQKAEQLIDFYDDDLRKRLKACGVADVGIWVYQCEALVDAGEMVEVRHRLNVRRQKLRKAIDFNNQQKKSAVLALRSFVVKHPEYEFDTKLVMERYGLTNQ